MVIRKGRLQVESAAKYKNGIASLFGLEASTGGGVAVDNSDGMIIDSASAEASGSEGGSSGNSGGNNVSPSGSSGQARQVENNNEKDGDSLTDRLLGD